MADNKYIIKIDNVDYSKNLQTDLSITKSKDGSFNGGSLYLWLEGKYTFNKFSRLYIEITNEGTILESSNWYVSEISSEKRKSGYRILINFIEPIKRLELITLPSISFTQPINGLEARYNLKTAIIRALTIAKIDSIEWEFGFYQTDLDFLERFDCPEFSMKLPTLLQVLKYLLGTINYVPTMKDYTYINIESLFTKRNLVVLDRLAKENQEESIEYYNTYAIGEIDNLFTDRALSHPPSNNKTLMLEPIDGSMVLKEENSGIILDYKIYSVNKISLKMSMFGAYNGETLGPDMLFVDFKVVEKTKYESLKSAQQAYHLFYSYGDNKIQIPKKKIESMVKRDSTHEFANYVKRLLVGDDVPQHAIDITKIEYFEFQGEGSIEYVPISESLIQTHRIHTKGMPIENGLAFKGALYLNEGINSNNAKIMSDILYQRIQGLGNDKLTVGKTYSQNYQEIIRIGDYTSDGWLVTREEFNYFRNRIEANYFLDKNHPNISTRLGINTSVRLFEIPSNYISRTIIFNDYVDISFSSSSLKSTKITTLGKNMFTAPFLGGVNKAGIKSVLFRNKSNKYLESNSQMLSLPINVFGLSNGICFKFGFRDNIAASTRMTGTTEGSISEHLPYVNTSITSDGFTTNGKMDYMYAYVIKEANNYPLENLSDYNPINDIIQLEAEVLKDAGEKDNYLYQLNITTDDNFVIGDKLTLKNGFVESAHISTKLCLCFDSLNRFSKNSNTIDVGDVLIKPATVDSDPYITCVNTNSSYQYRSWGIFNYDGDLLLGYNENGLKSGAFSRIIYLNFKGRR